MMNFTRNIALFFFLLTFSKPLIYSDEWGKPNSISEDVWQQIRPCLMPKDHPLYTRLTALFSSKRVLLNHSTIKKAGFHHSKPGHYSHVIVTEHDILKGYFFKMYSDSQQGVIDWKHCLDRVSGARSVQKAIDDFGYQKYFVVPKKWIFLLPENPKAPPGYNEQHFIVVAEKIKLHHGPSNLSRWKYDLSKKHIIALYNLFQHEGLVDSVYACNVRFTTKKRLALIDLEHHHQWPVDFAKMYYLLTPENIRLLKNLVESDGRYHH